MLCFWAGRVHDRVPVADLPPKRWRVTACNLLRDEATYDLLTADHGAVTCPGCLEAMGVVEPAKGQLSMWEAV